MFQIFLYIFSTSSLSNGLNALVSSTERQTNLGARRYKNICHRQILLKVYFMFSLYYFFFLFNFFWAEFKTGIFMTSQAYISDLSAYMCVRPIWKESVSDWNTQIRISWQNNSILSVTVNCCWIFCKLLTKKFYKVQIHFILFVLTDIMLELCQ